MAIKVTKATLWQPITLLVVFVTSIIGMTPLIPIPDLTTVSGDLGALVVIIFAAPILFFILGLLGILVSRNFFWIAALAYWLLRGVLVFALRLFAAARDNTWTSKNFAVDTFLLYDGRWITAAIGVVLAGWVAVAILIQNIVRRVIAARAVSVSEAFEVADSEEETVIMTEVQFVGNTAKPVGDLPLIALVLSIFMAPAGVILGHVAMWRIKRSANNKDGRGQATAALAIGYSLIGIGFVTSVIYGIIAIAVLVSRVSSSY